MWSKEPISLILSISVSLSLTGPLSEYALCFSPALPDLSRWEAYPCEVTHHVPYQSMLLLQTFFLIRKLVTISSLSLSFREGTHQWSGWPAWDQTVQESHGRELKSSAFRPEGVTDPRNKPSVRRSGPRGTLQDQLAMPIISILPSESLGGLVLVTHTPSWNQLHHPWSLSLTKMKLERSNLKTLGLNKRHSGQCRQKWAG